MLDMERGQKRVKFTRKQISATQKLDEMQLNRIHKIYEPNSESDNKK